MVDEGTPVHYSAVSRGRPVYGSDGVEVGKADTVLANYDEHIFDGIVLENSAGELRFVDAPEVQRTAERAVTLVNCGGALTHRPSRTLPFAWCRHQPVVSHSRSSRSVVAHWSRGPIEWRPATYPCAT